jgi:hypothetical protein
MLNVVSVECLTAEFRYVECHSDECRSALCYYA